MCPSVGPSVGPSETLFLGGQKQRWRTTYAVYLALFCHYRYLNTYDKTISKWNALLEEWEKLMGNKFLVSPGVKDRPPVYRVTQSKDSRATTEAPAPAAVEKTEAVSLCPAHLCPLIKAFATDQWTYARTAILSNE